MVSVSGALPRTVKDRLAAGEMSVEVMDLEDVGLAERLKGMSPDELSDYLALTNEERRSLKVRYDERRIVIDDGESRGKHRAAELIGKVEAMVRSVGESFPEMKPAGESLLSRLKNADCPTCGSKRAIGAYLGEVRKFADSAGKPFESILDGMIATVASFVRQMAGVRVPPSRQVPSSPTREVRDASIAIPENAGGPRPSCLDCCRKHLGKAVAQLGESELGYPHHFWLAMGNLSEMEEESLADHPDFAAMVREIRIQMIEDRGYKPDLMQLFSMMDELEQGSPENIEKQ